jgi:hypothetical protein
MRKLQFGMTALALCLMGLFLCALRRPRRQAGRPCISRRRLPRRACRRREAGIDPAALSPAAEFAAKTITRALVVGRNGHIVFEKYWGDTAFDTAVETGFEPVLVRLVRGHRVQRPAHAQPRRAAG